MAQQKHCSHNPTDIQRFLDDLDSDISSSSSSDDSEIQIQIWHHFFQLIF